MTNKMRAGWRVSILAAVTVPLFGCCPRVLFAQANKPVKFEELPRDGKPYNVQALSGIKEVARMKMWTIHYTENKGTEQEVECDCELYLFAVVMTGSDGGRSRRVTLLLKTFPKSDKKRSVAVTMNPDDLLAVDSAFNDGLRILRNWRDDGAPKKDGWVVYSPFSNLRVEVGKGAGNADSLATMLYLTENKKEDVFIFRTLEEYSAYVSTFEDFRKWIESR